MIAPPRHDAHTLEHHRLIAIDAFRRERLDEPVEEYHELFDTYSGVIEDLLEATVDLTALDEHAITVLSDDALAEAFRYLAGPPISKDDLKIVADANSLRPDRLRADPALLQRILQVVRDGLDRRRFVWVSEGRDPTETEKNAAVIADQSPHRREKAAGI
jgi:hypothetical protein